MKKLIAICLLFAACSKKQDQVPQGSAQTDFYFSKDTVFVREKDYLNINNTGNGMVGVYCQPAVHQLNLQYSDTSQKVHVSYRGAWLTDSRPFVVPADSNTLFCSADTPGTYRVDFYLTDQLGRVINKALMVKCTAGKKPTAVLQYALVDSTADNYLYFFNGAGSSQPYGTIVSYHYLINGQPHISSAPILKWFFHDTGLQQVAFHVTDDLGVSSDTLNYSIQIP